MAAMAPALALAAAVEEAGVVVAAAVEVPALAAAVELLVSANTLGRRKAKRPQAHLQESLCLH
ncbi:MAG TPA: hypothetical protein VLJ79_05815 [Candidatus Binatia bacterium]|nr:hypothetical protein [Candidatus Binatia bacterium]